MVSGLLYQQYGLQVLTPSFYCLSCPRTPSSSGVSCFPFFQKHHFSPQASLYCLCLSSYFSTPTISPSCARGSVWLGHDRRSMYAHSPFFLQHLLFMDDQYRMSRNKLSLSSAPWGNRPNIHASELDSFLGELSHGNLRHCRARGSKTIFFFSS